ncbi:MAG: amidohydrolase family protein, partial [Bacillota bacterium]|nr:amidohydrolase family protein [Bacillota bacterium]
GATVIDCREKWVIPGLIDLHVHLVWSSGEDPARLLTSESPLMTAYRAASNAARTVAAGITTVRDLGSNEDLAIFLSRAVEAGLVPGPRIIASGRTVVMTGGHDPFWGNMADGPAGVLRATREQIHAGAKVIKVSATGGVYGRTEGEEVGSSELNEDELRTIADEAHKFGLRVAAHAIGQEGIRNALRAGIDTVEHGHYLTPELLNFMVANDRSWVPTLHVYQTLAAGEGIPAYARRKAERITGRHLDAFGQARRRGVRIGAGSDAGSPGVPHPSLLEEVISLHRGGMEPWEALEAATSGAAAVLGPGLAHGLGRVEPGCVADLVVLDGNPLAQLENCRRVSHVVKGGVVVHVSGDR